MNRRSGASDRFAARRQQEDEAPRLKDVAPDLTACRIELAEARAGQAIAEVNHVRHLVVERAAALVLVACADPSCRDGGHDITYTLLRGFREREVEIRGESACHGSFGTASCARVLRFVARATYRDAT